MVKKSNSFKNIVRGICIGIAITIASKFGYGLYNNQKKEKEFIDSFDAPKITDSVKFKKKVTEKKYTFKYYGQDITLQDENLRVIEFDKNGNPNDMDLDTVVVEKDNNDINFNNYLSEDEYIIYNNLKYKDNIDTQYKIYTLFIKMRELSEELLNRDNCEDRIDYLYNNCLLYIEPESKYTIGKLKFEDLNGTIQKDIKKEILKIKYIKDNGSIKEETKSEKISNTFTKILKYDLFNLGK